MLERPSPGACRYQGCATPSAKKLTFGSGLWDEIFLLRPLTPAPAAVRQEKREVVKMRKLLGRVDDGRFGRAVAGLQAGWQWELGERSEG